MQDLLAEGGLGGRAAVPPVGGVGGRRAPKPGPGNHSSFYQCHSSKVKGTEQKVVWYKAPHHFLFCSLNPTRLEDDAQRTPSSGCE